MTSSEALGVTPQFTRSGFLNRKFARPSVRVCRPTPAGTGSRGRVCTPVRLGAYASVSPRPGDAGGLPGEGAQLAANPREGYGTHPNNLKPSSCPLVLTQSFLVKASLHVPSQSRSGKLKIKTLPPPKRKREATQKGGSGGRKGEGLGPPILLWFLGPAAASLEKNGGGGIQGPVARSPSWPGEDPPTGRAMPGRPSPGPQNRPPSLSVNVRCRERGEVAERCRDLAPCSCSIFF